MRSLDDIFQKKRSLDEIFAPSPQFSKEDIAKVKANNEEYAKRVEDIRPFLDKNPVGRLGVAVAQGISNSALNPAGYVARAYGMDTKPFTPQNAVERGVEKASEYGYDALALGGVGNIAKGAGYLGKGNTVTSKVLQDVFSPENLVTMAFTPAVGGGFAEGVVNPTNEFERTLVNVVGGGALGGLASGVKQTSKPINKGLKGALPDNEANKALSKGIRASEEVAEQVSSQAPSAYNSLNDEMENALNKAVGRKLNHEKSISNQQERIDDFIGKNADKELLDFSPTKEQLATYPAESSFNPNNGYSRADAMSALEKRANNLGIELHNNIDKLKESQFNLIKSANPMTDDYHTGIRSIEDIKTWEEAINDADSFVWGDFSKEQAEQALKSGKVKVYSSKPIKEGGFVSTSKNQAKDYAGGGKIYEQEVPLQDVAWINGDEGQYAPVNIGKGHLLKDVNRIKTVRTLENTVKNPDIKYSKGGRDYYTKKYDNLSSGKSFDFVITDENGNLFDKFNTDANYLKNKLAESVEDVSLQRPVIGDYGGEIHSPISSITSANAISISPESIVVNRNLPRLKQFTQGLDEFQTGALNQAIDKGATMSTNSKGSLGATHRAQEVLNDMIEASYDTSIIGQKKPTTETRELMGVKDRLKQILEPSGIKPYDVSYSKAQALKSAFEKGYNFKPSELKFENMGLATRRDKQAFLQGRMQKLLDNTLSDGGTNLATVIKKDENTLKKLMSKDKFDNLMNTADKIETQFKRLKSLEGQANRRLVKDTTTGSSINRENFESRGAMLGRLSDIIGGAINRGRNIDIAKQYLNSDELVTRGGLKGFLKGSGTAGTRQLLIDLLNNE